jgi:phosphoribosylformimino-5-aminoimidazole carboxamide ribotide isomerase
VIVTSWVFRNGTIEWKRLEELVNKIGKERLILDLSCRVRDGRYFVVTDRWQKFTDFELHEENLVTLANWCDEFLIHAADVEGLCQGIDLELVQKLAEWSPIQATYAGGAKSFDDLVKVTEIGQGKIHLTIGSALDIFGGTGVRYEDCVKFNRELEKQR